MSQLLIPNRDEAKLLLFQDLYFVRKKILVQTSLQEANCAICGNDLEDGVSITAKRVGIKLRLFCQFHIPEE